MPIRRLMRGPSGLRSALAVAIVGVMAAACSSDKATAPSGPPPVIGSAIISANPFNTLSAVVTFTATNADSARVVYTGASDPGGVTPATIVASGGQGKVVTLGLLPLVVYTHILQVFGRGNRMVADTLHVTTADLPSYVKQLGVTFTGVPSGGLTLIAPLAAPSDTGLIAAVDSLGRIRWYRLFPGVHTEEAKQQPNGDFTTFVFPPSLVTNGQAEPYGPAASGSFIEYTPAGDSVAEYDAGASLSGDGHELWLTGSPATGMGAAHLVGAENRPGDLSSIAGPASTTVVGHHVRGQTGTGSGTVQFDWNAWDVYGVSDWIEPTGVNPPNDFDHPNALEFDSDSNYIVSFRHMGAIIKLNAQTGAIMWQLGGARTQFTILNDPLGLFSGQHCVRILPNGNVLMYDNGLRHTPQHTRAVEYALDFTHMTATMVWEYEPSPMVFTPIVGSVERLSNGNTLVGFGVAGLIDEVDASSHLISRGLYHFGGSHAFYRAIRMASLYQYSHQPEAPL